MTVTPCPTCGALPDGIGGGTGCPPSCVTEHPAAAAIAALGVLERILLDPPTDPTPEETP